MTPEQYLNQLVNQYVDGGQCIGLASTYSRKYLGTPDFFNHDAKDVFNYAPDILFTKILNNPQDYNQHPEEGDIIIWNAWNGNPYGHIAVCSYTSNGINFVSYDQNWPSGSKVHRQLHDYGSVRGWLRPKNRFWLVDPQIAINAAKEAARIAEANRIAAEKLVEDAKAVADKIEADRLIREAQAKLELENAQAKLVEEVRIAKEIADKLEAERIAKELKDKEVPVDQIVPVKGQLNKAEVLSALRGGLYTFGGVLGAQLLLLSTQLTNGSIDLRVLGITLLATAISILGNIVKKLTEGR